MLSRQNTAAILYPLALLSLLATFAACKSPGGSASSPGPQGAGNGAGTGSGSTDNSNLPGPPANPPGPATASTTIGSGSPNGLPTLGNISGTPSNGLITLGGSGSPGSSIVVNFGTPSSPGSQPLSPIPTQATITIVPSSAMVNNSSNSTNPCTSVTTCQPINPDLMAPLTASGSLVGSAGQNVSWVLVGLDQNSLNATQTSSARNVLVIVYNLPNASATVPMMATGQLSNLVQISWTPPQAGSGSFSLLLRDYDRCVLNANAATCGQFGYLSQFDTRLDNVPFAISAAGAALPATSAGAPAASQTAASPGNLLTSLLTSGLQGLISKLIPAVPAPGQVP